jgi:hypothetical protein
MSFAKRAVIGGLAALALLVLAVGANADSFQLTYSGTNISGSATLTATPDGGGVYTVTAITGWQILNGSFETITGLMPLSGGGATTFFEPDSSFVIYDNLIYLTSSPQVDVDGLFFKVSGQTQAVNLCSNPGCGNPGTPYAEDIWVGSGGNEIANHAYQDYAISSLSIVKTPEPSVLILLGSGLAVLFLFNRRK